MSPFDFMLDSDDDSSIEPLDHGLNRINIFEEQEDDEERFDRRVKLEAQRLLRDYQIFPLERQTGFRQYTEYVQRCLNLDDKKTAQRVAKITWHKRRHSYKQEFRFQALVEMENKLIYRARVNHCMIHSLSRASDKNEQ